MLKRKLNDLSLRPEVMSCLHQICGMRELLPPGILETVKGLQ